MTIKDLLRLELGETVSVFNKPFLYNGKARITLDNETKLYWYFDDEDGMLAIAPEEEELLLFTQIDEELEPDEVVLFQNKEYEFTYEDAGVVAETDGETIIEEGDRYLFSDYQSADGELIRLVSNENTGETIGYVGRIVSEDDLTEL